MTELRHGTILLSLFLLACGTEGSESQRQTTTVRDSAGITIVENSDSVWTEETRWAIASDPELVIGSVDGSVPGTDFGWARDVIALGSGGVAVLEGRLDEVRVFGPDGTWDATFGGSGDGPAELRSPTGITALPGDSVAVFDVNARKMVVFPLSGGEPRVTPTVSPFHAERYGWDIAGWREDGSYLLEARDTPGARPPGVRVDSARLVLFSADGDSLKDVGSVPMYSSFSSGTNGGRVTFSRWAVTRVHGPDVYHGFPEVGFQYEVLNSQSAGRRIVRRSFRRVASPEGAVEETARQQLAEMTGASTEQVEAARAFMGAMEALDSLPAYWDLRVGATGDVWANHLVSPETVAKEDQPYLSSYTSLDWTVFDPDGRWLGTLRMPEGFEVHDIGPDWVLGVRENDLGVPFVERYRVLKP